MSVWIIMLLGIVQGASEFLPISSSGHLVVLYNVFGVQDNTILLSVILHIATLIAVVICYFKDILELIKHPFCNTNKKLACATIPTATIVLILKSLVEKTFSGSFVIVGFLITAIVLLISQKLGNSNKNNVFETQSGGFVTKTTHITNLNITYKQAFCVGVAQGIAIFPGISRSGSTIATGLICGVNKTDAADFSFLLSIPIIVAGMLFELIDVATGKAVLNISVLGLLVGFVLSFLSGLLCIKLMLKFVKNKKLTWFSFYLIGLSCFLILNEFVFKLF